jgi:uroporphyrinogen decarboxylase
MSMTTHERFTRMFEHRPADRVPILDTPWGTTLARWRREGMPQDADWREFFGLDNVVGIGADFSPRYDARTVEETNEYRIYTTSWGATLKQWKHIASTPDFLDFRIKDRESWAHAKARMTPSRDRVDWNRLQNGYAAWRRQGAWIRFGFWFGFDITHSWTVGTERVLMALVEDPDWCVEMFNHELDMCIAQAQMVLDEGYAFDAIDWPDDLGYKGHLFMSPAMYRELLKPVHKRAIDWAHQRGIKACMHSCGDVEPLVADFVDMGLDALNPLEVKAGVDALKLKRTYGQRLVLHGGMNAVLWSNPDAMEAEVRAKLPELKTGGGYIWSTDHSVPDVVSLESFRRIVAVVKEVGAY